MLSRQLSLFILFGFATVAVDSFTYSVLLYFFQLSIANAKAVGFLTGTFFAYIVNKRWTFSNQIIRPRSYQRFFVLYASTLLVNVYVNHVILYLLNGFSFSIEIAFLFATMVSAILNFLGMKFFVF
jgi:putative flippase GtrA